MYGRAILQRKPDGKLECVFPKICQRSRRGGTAILAESRAILAEIKESGRHFRPCFTRPKTRARKSRIPKDDSSLRRDARTCKAVLPASGSQKLTIGPRADVVAQKQVTGPAETDDENVSDTEDERPARDRGRESSETLEELSWMAELDEGYELRESLRERQQMARDSGCRRGPSPDPQRTRPRG